MKTLILALLLVDAVAFGQNQGTTGALTFDPEVQDCASGKSTLTNQQCAFLTQAAHAIRQVNALIASGEYAKLPTRTQEAVEALVDTVRSALPLMKEPR